MTRRFKLTDANIITKCPLTKKGERAQRKHWDSVLRGFGVVCGRNVRTFIVRRDVAGRRHVDVKLGRFGRSEGELTADAARARAHEMLAAMARGIDPNKRTTTAVQEKRDTPDILTLRDALDLHVQVLKQAQKSPRSIADIHKPVYWYMPDWLDKPLATITPHMCFDRHCAISQRNVEIRTKDGRLRKGGGRTVADRAMEAVRAAWNAIRKLHRELPEHPLHVTWNKAGDSADLLRIPFTELATWRAEITAQFSAVRRDWVLTALYTGLRATDCASIRWEDIDFERGTLHRPTPKGGKKRKFTVPVSTQVLAIFERRRKDNRFEVEHDHGYVFPTYRRNAGAACSICGGPCRITYVQTAKMRQHTFTVRWSMHALRRTFAATGAESDVAGELRDVLLNHKEDNRDMTRRYPGRPSDDRLRDAAQRIADALDERMQPANSGRLAALAGARR